MQIGIYTFAETTPDPATGRTVAAVQRLRDLIEEIEGRSSNRSPSSATASRVSAAATR
jgi:hypothetical protein